MAERLSGIADLLWHGGLAVIPLVVLAGVLARWLPCRPATRHSVWLIVLVWLVVSPWLPAAPSVVTTSIDSTEAMAVESPAVAPHDRASESALHLAAAGIGFVSELDENPHDAPGHAADRTISSDRLERSFGDPMALLAPAWEDAKVWLSQRLAEWPAALPLIETNPPRLVARTAPDAPDSLAQVAGVVGLPAPGISEHRSTPPRSRIGEDPRAVHAPQVVTVPWGAAMPADWRRAATPAVPDRWTEVAQEPAAVPLCDVPALAAADTSPAFAAADESSADEVAPNGRMAASDDPYPGVGAAERTMAEALEGYVAALISVRDGLARLPRIPPTLWGAGLLLIVGVQVAGALRFRAIMRRAIPADSQLRREVHRVAQRMGLTRMPETLVVNARISPLVWCGRRVRLVLPLGLWRALDETGRHAVLCHEMAHIRRRDHWVMWFESVVGGLYWWHPLVWWVRSRLRAEAENCCDAWVTWLMPEGRRAYAEALLRTRQYMQSRTCPAPVVGAGITNGRAAGFARRLTMVMTHQTTPRHSPAGIALVCALALTGWAATPARSGPTRDKSGCETPCPGSAQKVKVEASPAPEAASTFEAHLAARAELEAAAAARRAVLVGTNDNELDARLERLEEELERLSHQLAELGAVLRDGRAAPTPRAPRVRAGRASPVPAPAPIPPTSLFGTISPPAAPAPPQGVGLIWSDGSTTWRTYELSKGKLEALTALMSRSDVPVLIRPQSKGIEVQATEGQHAVFRAFVDMINARKEVRFYEVSPGKLEELSKLMIRSDVPTLVEPKNNGIKVHGTSLEQSVFESFIRLIDPQGRVQTPRPDGGLRSDRGASATPRHGEAQGRNADHVHVGAVGHGHPCSAAMESGQRAMERAHARQHEAAARIRDMAQRQKEVEKQQQKIHQRRDQAIKRKLEREREASQASEPRTALDEELAITAMADTMIDLPDGDAVELVELERLMQLSRAGELGEVLAKMAQLGMATKVAGTTDRLRVLDAQARALEDQSRVIADQARQLELEAQALDDQVQVIEEIADEVDQQADELQGQLEQVEDGDAEAPANAGELLQRLFAQAGELRGQAGAMVGQVHHLEQAAESLSEEADAYGEAAEALREVMELLSQTVSADQGGH